MTEPRRWVTKEEVAEHLQISVRTVRRMVEDGQIRAYRCGPRLIRFDLAEIDESMQSPEGATS